MINSYEAEQFLIGSLIYNPHGLLEIALMPDDFSEKGHAQLFTRAVDIFEKNQSLSLADFTGTTPYVDYVRSLVDCVIVPSMENIKNYAQIIRECATQRRILEACDRIKSNPSLCSADMTALLCDALTASTEAVNIRPAVDVHQAVIKSLSLPTAFDPSGLPALDVAMAGGFYPGFTYGFCGAEKSGKTTLAHTISYNLARAGCKHLYIALEMGSRQIEERNLARDMGVNSLSFLNDRPTVLKNLSVVPPRENLFYMDLPGATTHDILSGVSASMLRHGIKGFIVDYWQLVQGQDGRETEEKHTRTVAQNLSNFARKHGLWCILLAQMNQDGKLFGGNGLRKACDQLYMIEQIEGYDDLRWIRMDASRYTLRADIGSNGEPSLKINKRIGPYFEPAR